MSMPTDPYGKPFPPPGNPYQAPGFGQEPPSQLQGPALGIASLLCGVLGIVLSCCCGLFAIPFPLLAIGLGVFALVKSDAAGRGMGMGGIILGVIALAVVIGMFVLILTNPDFMQQFQQMQNQ